MIPLSKKGQLQTLAPVMISLILASALLIFGLVMMQEVRDTDVISQAVTSTIDNETVTAVSEVPQDLANVGHNGASGFTALIVYNASTGDLILANNYTLTSSGSINMTSGSNGNNGSDLNVTYTYSHGDEAYTDANATIIGLGTFADFWEIIVLAIVITIVIGLLLMAFGGNKQR